MTREYVENQINLFKTLLFGILVYSKHYYTTETPSHPIGFKILSSEDS